MRNLSDGEEAPSAVVKNSNLHGMLLFPPVASLATVILAPQ